MARVLVIGAGVVGLCCAYNLLLDGHEVTVLDREPGGNNVSTGNAGGIGVTEIIPASMPGLIRQVPGWLADPLGPLSLRLAHLPRLLPWLWCFLRSGTLAEMERITTALASLTAPVYDDLVPLLDTLGMGDDLHRVGALWVYETRAAFERDAGERALRERHGIVCEEIGGAAARELEPALGDNVACAMLTPQWSHLSDPRRLLDRLSAYLARRGVSIMSGEAVGIDRDRVHRRSGDPISFDVLVIAAGAWSGRLAKLVGDRALIESERGYNTTLPNPGVALGREIIFAEHKFVATPMDMGLRIGGAAEFAGLDAAPNFARSRALTTLAKRYLPGLDTRCGTVWMGQRPTTADSLPVIGPSRKQPNVFYAFGHGHTGLTLGPTTGRLVADLVAGRAPPIDLSPFTIARFG